MFKWNWVYWMEFKKKCAQKWQWFIFAISKEAQKQVVDIFFIQLSALSMREEAKKRLKTKEAIYKRLHSIYERLLVWAILMCIFIHFLVESYCRRIIILDEHMLSNLGLLWSFFYPKSLTMIYLFYGSICQFECNWISRNMKMIMKIGLKSFI